MKKPQERGPFSYVQQTSTTSCTSWSSDRIKVLLGIEDRLLSVHSGLVSYSSVLNNKRTKFDGENLSRVIHSPWNRIYKLGVMLRHFIYKKYGPEV